MYTSAVNGKSLRFPPQATEKLRAFHHSTFIVLASLGKWYSFADFCTSIMPKLFAPIELKPQDKIMLEDLTSKGNITPRIYKRARILLLSQPNQEITMSVEEIMKLADVSRATVFNVRRDYKERGVDAIYELPRPGRPSVFAGAARAEITALACSQAPEGFARWSLRMLANRYVELHPEESISHVQISKILKKTN
jgi:putative transposase